MVAENDIAALKEKLLLLLNDDALREEFSRNAKREIEENGSIECMFSGFMDCVNFLAGPSAARPTTASNK